MFLRDGTQDFLAFQEVYLENEYGLDGEFSPEDLVVDVGAHVGCFALLALGHGARRLVCLEPDVDNYALLKRNLGAYRGRADIDRRQVALWRSDGVRDAPGLCRFADDRLTAMHQVRPGQGTPVPVIGLDQLLDEVGPVRLLKMDCEGSEYPAIYTATGLRAVREIVAEVHLKLEWPDSPLPCTAEGLAGCLSRQGFLVEVKPHGRAPEYLAQLRARRNDS